MTNIQQADPALDLVLERTVDVPRELIWEAWTKPELLKQWFTPAPWTTAECEIDLRPGGKFRTLMRGPEGEEFDGVSCFLEIVPNQKLVWTSALGEGYRPHPPSEGCTFTAIITLEEHQGGTKYRVLLVHADAEAKNNHDGMGFQEGWGKAFDQLIAVVKPA